MKTRRRLTTYALYLPFFACLLLSMHAWSQGTQPDITEILLNKPLTAVEVMPEFIGGEVALMNYISKNVHYPLSAQLQGIQGRDAIRFIVNKDGSIKDVEVIRSLNPDCDQEAVRVIKSMPKWIPGRQNGVVVAVYYTIPIVYKLDGTALKLPPLTLIQLIDGKSVVANNATINKDLPLIIIDNKPYQIVGLDYTSSTAKEILQAINPSMSEVPEIESTTVIKGEAAEQLKGVRGKNGIILITTKKKTVTIN